MCRGQEQYTFFFTTSEVRMVTTTHK